MQRTQRESSGSGLCNQTRVALLCILYRYIGTCISTYVMHAAVSVTPNMLQDYFIYLSCVTDVETRILPYSLP